MLLCNGQLLFVDNKTNLYKIILKVNDEETHFKKEFKNNDLHLVFFSQEESFDLESSMYRKYRNRPNGFYCI